MENEPGTLFKLKNTATIGALLLLFVFILITAACDSSRAGAVNANAQFGVCPVCHMKVKSADDWMAEIYYNDQTKLMFETPGDMLAFYTSPANYGVDDAHRDLARIERINVKDYQSKQSIDARQAKFVYQSKVEGPMGPDFLTFAKREDAEAFVAANGGTLLSLTEVTAAMARDLRK